MYCIFEDETKICTIEDGKVICTKNKVKGRLKSIELFDWLLVGWKFESVGAPKVKMVQSKYGSIWIDVIFPFHIMNLLMRLMIYYLTNGTG